MLAASAAPQSLRRCNTVMGRTILPLLPTFPPWPDRSRSGISLQHCRSGSMTWFCNNCSRGLHRNPGESRGDDRHASVRTLAIVLLLAGVALTGCRTGQAEEPAAPATRPPAAAATPRPGPQPAPPPTRGPIPHAVHLHAARRPGSGLRRRPILGHRTQAGARLADPRRPTRSALPPTRPVTGWCSASTGWVALATWERYVRAVSADPSGTTSAG